jgi:O-antigen ligase
MPFSLSIKSAPYFFFYLLLVLLPVQLGRHFWPSQAYIFGIRIDYLSPTFYLSDLIIFLLFAFWSWQIIFSREKVDKSKILLLFSFPLSLAISLIFSKSFSNSLYFVAKIFEMSLLALFIVSEIDFRKEIKKILTVLSFGVFWESILGIFQFFSQHSLGLWVLGERLFSAQTPGISLVDLDGRQLLRPYGTFPHPNLLGAFLALLLPALLILFFSVKNKSLFLFLTLIVGYLALGLTFSRISWLCGFGISFFVLGYFFKKSRPKISKRSLLLFLTGVLLFIFVWPYFWQRFVSFSTTDSHSFILRVKLSSSAFLIFLNNPLFGVGPGNFLPNLPKFFKLSETIRWLQPVHNIFLLVLSEAGLLGLFSFLGLFFWPFFRIFKLSKKSLVAKVFVFSFIAIFIMANFDHYLLTLQQGQLIFWIFLGLSLSYLKCQNNQKRTPKTVLE